MITPIITSLLNNDWYVPVMWRVIRRRYPDTEVRYGLTNRSAMTVRLPDLIDRRELVAQLDAVRALRFTEDELTYLKAQGIFDEEDLDALRHLHLPPVVALQQNGELVVEVTGRWQDAIWWEIPILSIVNELAARGSLAVAGGTINNALAVGRQRLEELVEWLRANPDITFAQFGARRRFSNAWERELTLRLAEAAPDRMVAVSNMEYAKLTGKPVSGTIAHQMFMVPAAQHMAAGTVDPLVVAQNEVLDLWEEHYADFEDGRMLVAIPDTYGTDFFLEHFQPERAERWKRFKQDSGVPADFNQKLIDWHAKWDLALAPKSILHTDGLTIYKMRELKDEFGDLLGPFGWGTHCTNNVGVPTLSIVVKPIAVKVDGAWEPVVKLSDNIEKGTGDPATLARYKQAAGYTNTYAEACLV